MASLILFGEASGFVSIAKNALSAVTPYRIKLIFLNF